MQAISHDDIFLGSITISSDARVFYIDGYIGENTLVYFKSRVHRIKTVVLNSSGGYIFHAEEIARLIRKYRINTTVKSDSKCFSACVLIFQAGIKRIADRGSVFMLHSVKINIHGVDIMDVWETNRFRKMLILYGMKVGAMKYFRREKDVYFSSDTALFYGLATAVVEK